MPTILESIVSSYLGANLDEKASTSLLGLPSAVSSLSIVNNVTSNQEEVRNISAFVSRAVRNAQQTPGKLELESALTLLEQARQLDEKAIRELQGKSVQAACSALSVLLQQQEGSVRNPSAYVCRNLQNDRRGPEEVSHAYVALPPPRPAPSHVPVSQPSIADSGLISAARPPIEITPGGLEILDKLLAKWRSAIDEKAWQSLMALDSLAVDILQELDQKGDQVRSPSAYVQRAVGNAKAGHMPGRPRAGVPSAPPERVMPATPSPRGNQGPSTARRPSQRETSEERAPSAYSRASNGKQASNMAPPPSDIPEYPEYEDDVLDLLDEDATRALENISAEAARNIMQQLSDHRQKVNNPSAYVMKAVRNAQHETPAPGAARPTMQEPAFSPVGPDDTDSLELDEEFGQLSSVLDDKAMDALQELPTGSALHIIRNLRKQESQVTNASAWVCKAVGNMKRPAPPAAPEFAKRARV